MSLECLFHLMVPDQYYHIDNERQNNMNYDSYYIFSIDVQFQLTQETVLTLLTKLE